MQAKLRPRSKVNQRENVRRNFSAGSFVGQAHVVQEGTDHRHADLAGTGPTRAELSGTDLDHIEQGHDLAGCTN